MCFSATASFSATAILSFIAYKSIKLVRSRKTVLFALTPLFFAIQQSLEGFIWVFLMRPTQPPLLMNFLTYGYLAFTYFIWPFWLPLSTFIFEKNPARKKIMLYCVAAGVLFCLYNVGYFFTHTLTVNIYHHSIQYNGDKANTAIYFPVVFIPLFLSTNSYIKLIGIIGLIANIATLYFYKVTFLSVWCFFAALISLMYYLLLKNELTKVSTEESLKKTANIAT